MIFNVGSGLKGFFLATLSGLSEPVGALIAWAIVAACGQDMSLGRAELEASRELEGT